jgi:Fe-S-cluster containining protein
MQEYLCCHCKKSMTFIDYHRSPYCHAPACQRHKVQVEITEQKKMVTQVILEAAKKHLHEQGKRTVNDPIIAVLPANTNKLIKANKARHRAFLEHLSAIYKDVKAGDSFSRPSYHSQRHPSEKEAVSTSLSKACGTCKGLCCGLGKTHAFQDYHSLALYLKSHPELTEEELLSQYKAELPNVSYQHACVFQGEKGCTLPSEMRSITCNNYQCEGLIEYKKQLYIQANAPTFAGAVMGKEVINIAIFDADSFEYIKEA